jgi:hypothetical protein
MTGEEAEGITSETHKASPEVPGTSKSREVEMSRKLIKTFQNNK